MLLLIYYSQQKHTYFDHKNILFIYFALFVMVYIEAILVALFLEFPFRTMAKVVFSPPNKVIRLKAELADELNINVVDEIFNDKDEDDIGNLMSSNMERASLKGYKP